MRDMMELRRQLASRRAAADNGHIELRRRAWTAVGMRTRQ
jgi:hypothetical protein